MFKFQVTLDRHSPKYCLLPNKPHFRYYQSLKEVVLIEEKNLFGFFDGQQDERHVTETGMQASF
jgi:hypothetical protein